VALNPVIKFTTLFGLLAVELAVSLTNQGLGVLVQSLAAVFFVVSAYFVWRSFYRMRIRGGVDEPGGLPAEPPEPNDTYDATAALATATVTATSENLAKAGEQR
jgi:K(+)-stimulated pyrophosphate-energized sodium pump